MSTAQRTNASCRQSSRSTERLLPRITPRKYVHLSCRALCRALASLVSCPLLLLRSLPLCLSCAAAVSPWHLGGSGLPLGGEDSGKCQAVAPFAGERPNTRWLAPLCFVRTPKTVSLFASRNTFACFSPSSLSPSPSSLLSLSSSPLFFSSSFRTTLLIGMNRAVSVAPHPRDGEPREEGARQRGDAGADAQGRVPLCVCASHPPLAPLAPHRLAAARRSAVEPCLARPAPSPRPFSRPHGQTARSHFPHASQPPNRPSSPPPSALPATICGSPSAGVRSRSKSSPTCRGSRGRSRRSSTTTSPPW